MCVNTKLNKSTCLNSLLAILSQLLVAVIFGSLTLSVPRYFEYHLAHRKTQNGTSVLEVKKNEHLFGYRVYVIGYRIVLSFLVIYVIPMTTLVALNGRIVAALWRASRGNVEQAEPSGGRTSGSQRGRDR